MCSAVFSALCCVKGAKLMLKPLIDGAYVLTSGAFYRNGWMEYLICLNVKSNK